MSEVTLKNGQAVPPKRKKRKSVALRIIVAVLIVFIGIPLLLLGLIFALFYDGVHTDIKYRQNYKNEEVFNDIITHSLDYAESQHQMRVRVTEDALNQLFHNVTHNEDDEKIVDVINNLYVKITDKNYVFVLELNLYGFFKTRLFLTTKLQVEGDEIIFKVTDFKVGRVGKLNNLASIFVKMFKIPDVNEIFESNGFHMKLDIATLSIRYPKEYLLEDLGSALGESASGYLSLFTEVMFNENITTIVPNSEKAIELNINLENMRPTGELFHITGYEMPGGYLDTIMPNAINKVKGYLESGVVAYDDANALVSYYVRGYEHLEENYKPTVDNYLSAHTIDEATDTYDYEVDNDDNVSSIIGSQLSHYPSGADYYECSLTTDQIDCALSQAGAIGTTLLFKSIEEDESYTLNYLVLDRVTNVIDAGEDDLFITLSMNVNGYDTGLTLRASMDHEYDIYGKARFLIEDMYVGNEAISDDAKSFFLDLITDAIQDGAVDNVVSLVQESGAIYLYVDIRDLLEAHNVRESDGYVTSYEMTPQTATEAGIMTFKAQR